MKIFSDSLITTLTLLIGAILSTTLIFFLLNPIPQLDSYHHFADQRSWLQIPNTWNVLSNIAIAVPGIWGLFVSRKIQFKNTGERWFWVGISIGLILTAAGSSYYHLAPDNSRLVLDRLPMTLVFMSLVAALISERLNLYLGLSLWPILLAIGFYSVWFWYTNNDLRFYLGIQAFSILTAIIMFLSPSNSS